MLPPLRGAGLTMVTTTTTTTTSWLAAGAPFGWVPLGEGVIGTIEVAPATFLETQGPLLLTLAVVAAVAVVGTAGRLEFGPPRRKVGAEGAEAVVVVRWSSPRAAVYEGVAGSSVRMRAGSNEAVVGDLAQATALVRRLDAAVPGRGPLQYRVLRAKSYNDFIFQAEELPPLASFAAADVDDGDAALDDEFRSLVRPTLRDDLRADGIEPASRRSEVVVVGGEDGLVPPCNFCAGRGTRLIFNERRTCDYCTGLGYVDTDVVFDR